MTMTAGATDLEPARLVSGEAVHLEIRLAKAGSRALALMIDIGCQFIVGWLLLIVGGLTLLAMRPDAELVQTLEVVIIIGVFVFHQALWETFTAGRTPGKFAMGLRVVRDDGGPIQFRHAVVRALISATLEWPGLLLPLVTWTASLLTMSLNPQGKRLGDLAAGTIVIHERSPAGWGWIPTTPPPLAEWASTLDLTALDDELALAIRHFLARSRQLKEPLRTRLGMLLATEVIARTTPAPPPNTPGWAYLAAVLGERHRRASARLVRARAAHASLWPELFAKAPVPGPAAGYPYAGYQFAPPTLAEGPAPRPAGSVPVPRPAQPGT